MSDNEKRTTDPNSQQSSQPSPASPSQPPQPPANFSAWSQQVQCPVCHTMVNMGTAFCPNCGSQIPSGVPPAWPVVPPPPASKRNVALIVGIVLIAIIIVGIGGYAFYQYQQQVVLQAAKNSESDAANQSVNQLQNTCFTNRTDTSNLSYSNGLYYGSVTVYETFGISNPTRFIIDGTWRITLAYPGPSWVLTDTQSFRLAAAGAAYPTFSFSITGTQLNNLTPTTDFKTYTVTLDSNYLVTGTYATYPLTQHSTFDSSSNTGTGTIGSSGTTPKC